MADKKISQLTDGTSLQSGDFVVIARSGDNFKVDPTIFDEITATTVDINGGTIDGTTIGATTPGAATFSSLTATTADINGGTIDGATIGATTPSTGDFTTLTENTTPVVIQTDIGTDPNQVPLNQYLGSMAYQDLDAVSITGGTVVVDGLTVDTDTLYVDAANDRVGIGTSSPAASLDVAGQVAVEGTGEYGIFHAGSGGPLVGFESGSNLRFGSVTSKTASGFSEAMRLDDSGNLLVGTTTADQANNSTVANTGIALRPSGSGALQVSRDGAQPATFNRLTSDGEIISLRKDGVTVGQINSRAGTDIVIGSNDVGIRFHSAEDSLYPFDVSNNNLRDSAINIGGGNQRFKDLYLSGGVYLGGTGAANLLDDYEEGTFTPVVADASSGGNVASVTAAGSYVKTGSMVVARIQLVAIDTTGMTAGNEIYIRGLPFSSDSNAFNQANVSVNDFTFLGYLGVTFLPSNNYFRVKDVQSNVENDNLLVSAINSGTADLWCVLTYFTT
jgi:hypothetical protein